MMMMMQLRNDALWRLTSICLSIAYLRTERPRKTKIVRGSPRHMWLGHHIQGQKSRSPGRFTHRGLNAWGRCCCGDRENVLGVGNYCYVASARRRVRRCGLWAPTGEETGGGISCRRAYSLTLEIIDDALAWICAKKSVLVLVLQIWCCLVKHAIVMIVVIMILKDTATFQVLFIVSQFCAWNITTVEINKWRSIT